MASARSPTSRRILVVDDDAVSLAITALLLEAEGFTVMQAESGEQALDLLADPAARPDHGRAVGVQGDADTDTAPEQLECVLADLRMPGLCGTELAVRLREAAPRAILLAMSATPPRAIEGYDGILKKPLSTESLVATLASRRMPPRPAVAAADTISADGPVLDTVVFDRLRGAISPAALEEVISTFLNDTRARIRKMRSADAETVRREAHTVKGGAAMVGVLQVSLAAAAVESGIDDAGARSRKLDEMEAHCRRAEVILKQRLEA